MGERNRGEKAQSERATILTCYSIEPNRKRMYSLDVSTVAGFTSFSSYYIFSDFRIKQVCVELFQKWFHTEIDVIWGDDGFMAEAWDRRGNQVTISQINQFP